MRNIPPPEIKTSAIFEDCIASIQNAAKRQAFERAKHIFTTTEQDYLTAAKDHTLYKIEPSNEENEDYLFENLTKKEIRDLYSTQMVPATKLARKHYDRLIISPPQRKCPFCGFGRATTLDHFLNKSDYPWLSIVPINLVPACKECNHGKSARRAESANDQTLHPYFENTTLSTEQWLFASVQQTTPLTISYRAAPPMTWDQALRSRVEQHFVSFDLEARFAVEAAPELAALRYTLRRLHALAGREGVIQHLAVVAEGEGELFKNSWKTALYQALAASDWYVDGGYLLE